MTKRSKKRKAAPKKKEEAYRGRPTKITREMIEKVRRAIRGGAYLETCAALIGIHRDTFRKWMRWGETELQEVDEGIRRKPRKKQELYCELIVAIEQASAEAEAYASATLLAFAQGVPVEKEKTVIKYGPEVRDPETGQLRRIVLEETTTVEKSYRRDWRAALEFLDRRHPATWGKIDREAAIEKERLEQQDDRPIEWSFLGPGEEGEDLPPDIDPNDPRL